MKKQRIKDKTFGNINIIPIFASCKNNDPGVFREIKESKAMNPASIYNGLTYTTKEINRNFKIKVNGFVNGKKVNVAVGVSGLINIVGDIELVNRLLNRAFNCIGDKEICKLRRGVKITFYYQ